MIYILSIIDEFDNDSNDKGVPVMSGEHKNTIQKPTTTKTTRKKGLSQKQADILIAIVAMTWGSSYLMMKIGLTGIPPFSIIALRFCIAFLVVALIFLPKMKLMNLRTLGYGSILGLFLFGVFAFLVPGMKFTTASNAGFLIGIVSVFVPVVHSLLKRKLPSKRTSLGVFLALLGICLLTFFSTLTINLGDVLCILGAFCYTIQIILMDYFTQKVDSFLLGIWQLGFTGLYGVIFTFLFETPALPGSSAQWGAILGLAIVCSAFGFIIQPVAQRYTSPEHTSMLFALEPVFSMIFAYIFLHEKLSLHGTIGAALIMIGVLTAATSKE